MPLSLDSQYFVNSLTSGGGSSRKCCLEVRATFAVVVEAMSILDPALSLVSITLLLQLFVGDFKEQELSGHHWLMML
jgi:hypothetical protein